MKQIDSYTLAPTIEALIGCVGRDRLKRAVAGWRKALKTSRGALRRHLEDTAFPWWSALDEYWDCQRTRRPVVSGNVVALGKDAAKLVALWPGMPASVQKKFVGDLGSREIAAAALFELDIAHHFQQAGYTLAWCEDGGADRPEFIASSPSLTFEVECKRLSIDAGRRVAREDFCRLADRVERALRRLQFLGEIHVVLNAPLANRQAGLERIADDIVNLAQGENHDGSACFPWGEVVLRLHPEDGLAVDILAYDVAQRKRKLPRTQSVVMAPNIGGVPKHPVTFSVHCRQADDVLDRIVDRLDEAARRQLSGKRPGVLCLYLPGIRDFASLASGTGLEAVTAKFLSSESRRHVAAVVYSSQEQVVKNADGLSYWTHALTYRNPGCRFPEAATFRFFGQVVDLPVVPNGLEVAPGSIGHD